MIFILLKAKRVQKLIRDEIDKVLVDADITPLYLLEQMRSIVDSGDSQDRDKIQAIKNQLLENLNVNSIEIKSKENLL